MTDPATASENPTSDDWAGARGEKWLAQAAGMEAMLAPIDAPLIDLLTLSGARRIADLACGGGGTTLALANAADTGAAVFGYDISPALVAYARQRATPHAPAPAFSVADSAQLTTDIPFDRIASRFGTMFFADPPAAFANIARLLRPGGRFAFAVWGLPVDNQWMAIIRETIAQLIDLPAPPADAPGPMRYGKIETLVQLLVTAGFRDVATSQWRGTLAIGGGLPPRDAAKFAIHGMSVAEALTGHGPEYAERAVDLLAKRFDSFSSGGVVHLPAHVHFVHGTR